MPGVRPVCLSGVMGPARVSTTVSTTGMKTKRYYFLFFGAVGLVLACLLMIRVWGYAIRSVSAPSTGLAQFPGQWKSGVPRLPRLIAFRLYSQIVEGVSPIAVPYNPASGPWINLEQAIGGFANSNGIKVVRFEAAGSAEAFVCVRHKDANAMRKFVTLIGQGANNRTQR